VLVLGTFSQPLLIKDMLDFMSAPKDPSEKGWTIFGGFVCIYAIITVSIALYREKVRVSFYTSIATISRE
jgi:hypothetical protein